MDSANGVKCAICYDSVCSDRTTYNIINLTCGHAFGKSCMRQWIESSNQKKCLFCNNPLTDNEIKEIKNIPLQERLAIISEKAIKLFGQTTLLLAPSIGGTIWLALHAALVGGTDAGIVFSAAVACGTCITTGAAVGAVGAAAGVDKAATVIFGTVTGAAGAAAVIFGTITGAAGAVAATDGAFAFTVGVIGITAGVIGVNAGVIGVTAGAVTAVGAIGAVTIGAIGAAAGLAAAALGAFGAHCAYEEQAMNPVVV
ncbi:RING finger domain-containing protein [Endozoicomonas sp. ONNA2]|uniref:RING finger domain-containing protein n=1 Tax=Endozoicomonas sp. ONNA2 TaxID=2828741 RepID=UPI002147964A|nr:RING finger domain-containing protein [Endozoicomonas sp. ONNA2]